jgi:hypothetical protein
MARIENWNPPTLTANKAIYEWDVDYAEKVHEGEIGRSGNVYPARPWTDDAIGRMDIEQEFRQAWIASEDLNTSFEELSQILFNEFHVSMASSIWNWPSITTRKSGEIVGSPRTIIDLGGLYESQAVSLEYGDIDNV